MYIYIYLPMWGVYPYKGGYPPRVYTHMGVYPQMGGYTPRNPLRAVNSELTRTRPRRPLGPQLALARLGSTRLGLKC